MVLVYIEAWAAKKLTILKWCLWDFIFALLLANQSENGTSFQIQIELVEKYDFQMFLMCHISPWRTCRLLKAFCFLHNLQLNLPKKKKNPLVCVSVEVVFTFLQFRNYSS